MSDRLTVQSLGIGKTTVGEYVCRAKVIGTAPSFEERPKRPPLDWSRLHELAC
jgi:hypothetical protein